MHPFLTYFELGIYALFAALLLATAIIDARRRIIPNALILTLLILWLIRTIDEVIAYFMAGATFGEMPFIRQYTMDTTILDELIASLVFGGGSLVLTAIFERTTDRFAMGGGDIKLLFAIGLFIGIEREAIALIVACIAFLATALIRKFAFRKFDMGEPLPFGPFIAAGTIIAIF